jgi:hypothetical protein
MTIEADHELSAVALAAALGELLTGYPTDEPDAPRTTVTIQAPGGAAHRVQLMPGQVQWLTSLLMDEAATCRNAHSDQSGECGHCRGTGRVGASAPTEPTP